jgi:cytidine deaminase
MSTFTPLPPDVPAAPRDPSDAEQPLPLMAVRGPSIFVLPKALERHMVAKAWEARERARLYGPTAVGCAALGSTGTVVAGCNLEHRYRSHDIHAEANAIGSLVAAAGGSLVAVLIAADRSSFTPCGACLDWIFEVGGPDCQVGWQSQLVGETRWASAQDLMPLYPR